MPVRAALTLLRGYKVFISPQFRGSCRFLPSCADYAAEAIARHGLMRGGWLAVCRVARCHPLCKAGYDPVPTCRGRRVRVDAFRRTASSIEAMNDCAAAPRST